MSLYGNEFPLSETLIYLNHAAVAPWPARTEAAISQFAKENTLQGAERYDRWLKKEHELRQQLRVLINAPSTDDIALQKNTSEGLSVIAYGLDWQPGDRIIITNQEFPSNRIVWESLAGLGVEVIEADISGSDPELAIIQLLTPSTRLISVSSVQYGTGLTLNLKRLGAACKQNNTLFCVDAIQSIGVMPLDVQAIDADFVVADGHKWMLGPEGIALLYVREQVRPKLKLLQYGWHMVANAGNYDTKEWEPAASAKRFECGSPNMLGIHALSASLSLLLELGMEEVHRLVDERVEYLIEGINRRSQLQLLSPTTPERRSGIVTFSVRDGDNSALFQSLKEQRVVCALRGGGIRFSPHFYTPEKVLAKALELLP